MAHGFGAAPDGPLGRVARRFAAAGLAVFAFDYRGFGASDGEPRGIFSARAALEDWDAAIAYVRGRDDVDPSRVGLWGSSLSGGQVIAVAALDRTICAAVAQVPYSDGWAVAKAAGLRHSLRILPHVLRDLLHAAVGVRPHMIDWLGPPGATAAMSARYHDLYAELSHAPAVAEGNRLAARGVLEMYRFRPILLARQIRCPLLVVATYEDLIAPPAMAIRAAQALPYVEMAMFSGRHFDMYVGDVAARAHSTEAKFLAHHMLELGCAPAAATTAATASGN
jgi:pimeloyl-ACP methyl ester carboxylesterase